MSSKEPVEKLVRDIRRKTRRKHSTEKKIRIVLEGLRGEESIAESLYYSWSKDFLEARKKHLVGDTARQATSNKVKALPAEARDLVEREIGRPVTWIGAAPDLLERRDDLPSPKIAGSSSRKQCQSEQPTRLQASA